MNSNAVQSYTQALLRCYPDNTFPCDKYLLNRESETVEFYVTEFYDDYEPCHQRIIGHIRAFYTGEFSYLECECVEYSVNIKKKMATYTMRIRNPKYMKCNIELSDETKIITIRNFWAKVIDGYNNNSLISNPNKNGALHNGPCALKIRTTINNNDMRIIENQKREIGESIKNLIESHKPKGFVNTEYKLFSEFKYKNKEYYAVTYIKKIIR